MAWQTVATTGLGDGSATYGYVYLQYDDSSGGTSRNSRLRFEIRSGYSVYIYIDNLALDGGSVSGRFLCSGTMDFWTGSLSAGYRSFTWSCPWYSGTRSYTCAGTIPSGITAPSGLSVTLNSKTYNSATFKVSVSSYGYPSSADGRWIEAGVAGQNSWTSPSLRSAIIKNASSATITVNNSSTQTQTLAIEGNHKYWYGGHATNTQASTSIITGTFYTPCPPLTSLSVSSHSYVSANQDSVTLSYKRNTDGEAETRTGYYRYSTDGGSTYSGWVSFGTISAAAGTAATFTANLPTSSSIILQAKINTPNGGDSTIKSVSFSTLTTHTAPNFSNFEYQDSNSATVALTGNNQTMIQGQSTPQITISTTNKATGNDGVNVSNYSITFSGQSKTVAYSSSSAVTTTLTPPSDSGTGNMVVAAVDDLSLSKSVAKVVTIYPWSNPTINASIERVNNFESNSVLSASGTYAQIKVGNTVKNTIAVAYRTKKSSSSTWGSWTSRTATVSGNTWSISDTTISLDNNYQWDVQVRVVDKFVTTTADLIVSVGMPNFFIGVDGRVSVGMRPSNSLSGTDKGQIEVSGPIYSRGQPLMPSHVGQIILTTTLDTAAKVKAIYGGTWTQWGKGRVVVGMGSNGTTSYSTIEATGGEDKHKLIENELPVIGASWTMHSQERGTGFYNQYGHANGAKINNNYMNNGSQGSGAYSYMLSWQFGGDGSHENRQPYITCYMWKRTA